MLNEAQLIGHVGQDPEVRTTTSGKHVTNIRLATTEKWRDKNSGEQKEKTEWHSINCWGEGISKFVEQYIKKGSRIYVKGKLQTRKWQDNEGKDRYTTEIVVQGFDGKILLMDRKQNGSRPPMDDGAAPPDYGNSGNSMDDEIPF